MRKLVLMSIMATATIIQAASVDTVRAEPPRDLAVVVTHYRTADLEGMRVFYRDAGPKHAPVALLLHGFPTSSHMGWQALRVFLHPRNYPTPFATCMTNLTVT